MNRGANMWVHKPKDDFVQFEYKGKEYSIPRAEYNKPLTRQDLKRPAASERATAPLRSAYNRSTNAGTTQTVYTGNLMKNRPPSADANVNDLSSENRRHFDKSRQSCLEQCANEFKKTMMSSAFQPKKEIGTEEKVIESAPMEDPKIEQIYTLEDMVESKETVIELPIPKKRSPENKASIGEFPEPEPGKSSATLAVKSNESIDIKTCQEVAEKLCQLKSNVVSLIDQTINQFESEQQLENAVPLHPSGDGSKQNHRIENLKILKTDSFAQNKTEIRMKLYGEIEMAIGRLRDFELL
ncbi:uncharacterized protein LOC131682292 [Topomyia yanbarensis]|uniref:uncharacterized protein LOC131682292 n=1 Tax=Topomyia yanbarensis TaxID=2498891 RepID=UPI00273CCDA7|nr:uncharacterized protein LOC131682292 [Topomyia yanbarensis]